MRLRGAYGASGNQPGSTVALQTFNASTANIGTAGGTAGTDTPGLLAAALGNPDLKPERSVETEVGFETSVLNNRVHFDYTYYNKKTHDALVSQPIAASSGASTLSVVKNLGSVANSGHELSVNTTLLDRRALGWDVTVAASHNSNQIIDIGKDAAGKALPTIGTGTTRDSIGASINGFFTRPYTYADNNHDGIITPDEVTVSPNFEYVGYSVPRDIFSITNGIDLFEPQAAPHGARGLQGRVHSVQSVGPVLLAELRDVVLEQPQDHTALGPGALGRQLERQEPDGVDAGLSRERPVLEAARSLGGPHAAELGRQQDPRARRTDRLLRAQSPHMDQVHRYGSGSELQPR